jgi:hypothetical protein
MPQSQVQDGDIAEPDPRFRITPGGSEVERMRDSIRALAAPGGEDGADARVPQRLIPISQPILVFAGEKMAVPVKCVSANLTFNPQLSSKRIPVATFSGSGGLAGDSNRTRSPGRSRRGVNTIVSVIEAQDH